MSTDDEKISAEFRGRLMRLAPDQTVRAVVVLNLEPQPRRPGLQSRLQRSVALRDAANATKSSIRSLDRALRPLDARRISSSRVLGTVTIEGTAGAIHALAHSPHVKAVIEDQPLEKVDQSAIRRD